jgi:hypothetical protein
MWLLSISVQCWSLARQRESVRWAHFQLTGLQEYVLNGYRWSLPRPLRSQRRFQGFPTFRPRSDRGWFRFLWFRLSSEHPISERLPVCRHLEKRVAVHFVGRVLGQLQALSGVVLIFRDAVHGIKSTRRNGECSQAPPRRWRVWRGYQRGNALTLSDVRSPVLLIVCQPRFHRGATQTSLPICARLPPFRETVFDLPGR